VLLRVGKEMEETGFFAMALNLNRRREVIIAMEQYRKLLVAMIHYKSSLN